MTHTRFFYFSLRPHCSIKKLKTTSPHSVSKNIIHSLLGKLIGNVLLRTDPTNVNDLINSISTANIRDVAH